MAILFFSNFKPKPTTFLTLFFNISFLFLLSLFLKAYLYPSNTNSPHILLQIHHNNDDSCMDLHSLSDYTSKCSYAKTHYLQCNSSRGYINYFQIFYCNFGQSPILGYALLLLWLLVLFYLLGDTASNYFCHSLEGLSSILKLSPTIAGVTLLSLGNGASDVFASVISFTRSTNNGGDVGLNSILGGAFFISSVVMGIISTLISPKQIEVDKFSFIRDVIFFLFSLFILLVIIYIGEINLWGSICFLSIYFFYVCAVSAPHLINKIQNKKKKKKEYSVVLDLDMAESGGIPLLSYVGDDDEKQKPNISAEKEVGFGSNCYYYYYFCRFLKILELPLSLPRRLTIPIVSEEKWSKPYAVISVILAPIMMAFLCNTQRENVDLKTNLVTYLSSSLIGFILGYIASVTTKSSNPPRNCLFPWLAGGFAMSVIWTYITAMELVSLLYSLGNIIGVSPSILGLTVLAWGNSLGDLIANSAMAMKGGPDGAQIAISGCYAGPLFNTVMGLGLPFVLSAWYEYPNSYVIPKDSSLYLTLLFLIVGLLWALVILPMKNMTLDKSLGAGLLTIYLCFLFIRIAMAIGVLKL